MRTMNQDHMKIIHDELSKLSAKPDGGYDGWRYFLMAGLSLGFLEGTEEVGGRAIENLRDVLSAKEDSRVTFEDFEILSAAVTIFDKINKIHLNHEDLVQGVIDNVLYMINYYKEKDILPVDISWTCFELGWKSRYLASIGISLVEPTTGEVTKYGPWQ